MMDHRPQWVFGSILLVILLAACVLSRPTSTDQPGTPTLVVPTSTPTLVQAIPSIPPTDTPVPATATPTLPPTPIPPTPVPPTITPTPTEKPLPSLAITLGSINKSQGIYLDQGGDVDTTATTVGDPAVETRTSGNARPVKAADGNNTPDSYIQFNVDDAQIFGGKPTSHLRVEVDFFDVGNDTFSIQYDALSGVFAEGGSIVKTNTHTFRTAVFNLCNANFSNRDNGADFRLADNADGAEFIRAVRVIALPAVGSATIQVDDYGANPFDDTPDSDAIQLVLDSTCSGDTIVFTSGVGEPGYTGYLIDKTLFLTGMSAKRFLTFTASDPQEHALLSATADLKGYVVRLYARSRFTNAGDIDNIEFAYIDVDGGRDVRKCMGPDGLSNGIDDSWGSWLPECSGGEDAWCSPGNIGLDGGMDWEDSSQNYQGNTSRWTTGIYVHDLVDRQTECGSALAFFSAAGTIENVTIDTAGDHVHAAGCTYTDNDGDRGGWSDGITLTGPGHTIRDNVIINPSDIGIVFFGGQDTILSNNTITITQGNYGAFGGIALHPWIFGDVSGTQFVGNRVTSEGNSICGGLHAGINLGTHMWGGACLSQPHMATFGNPGVCLLNPPMENVQACNGAACQLWAYIPPGATFVLKDNLVTGAHINYLVEGLAILGEFVDENNVSQAPRISDWDASRSGCFGYTWGALDKVAHDPSLPGYKDMPVHCER